MSYFSQISINDDGYLGEMVEVTPMNELRVAQKTREIGTPFYGSYDPNFWTSGATTGATFSQVNGQVSLISAGAGNTSSIQSVRTARYISGQSNMFRTILRSNNLPNNGNTCKWGPFDANSGIYFMYSGSTVAVGYRKAGIDFQTSTFNGNGTWTANSNYNTYEIYMANKSYYLTYNDQLIHKFSATVTPLSDTLHLPIRIENINQTFTGTTQIDCMVASISTFGGIETAPTSYYSTGLTSGVQLKVGPGLLHGMILGDISANNAVVTFYDGTSSSGKIIMNLVFNVANQNAYDIDFHKTPFYSGLFMTKTTQATTITINYE